MSKEEIIEIIKEKSEDYMFESQINAYIDGYLDALCEIREITWDERYEIEAVLNEE